MHSYGMMKIKRSESTSSLVSERVQIAPRRLDGNRAECVSTKANALRRMEYNSYLFICRYVASQLDMFSLRSNSIYFAPQNSICCLTATRVDSAAPQIVTSLALPSATHIERVSAISSFVYLAYGEVCKTYRATRQRRISTLGTAEPPPTLGTAELRQTASVRGRLWI